MSALLSKFDDDQFYNVLFKNNVSIMLLIDYKTMKIVDANYAACTFYNYSYREFLNLSIADLSTSSSDQIQDHINLVSSQEKNSFTLNHRTSSGEIKNIRSNSSLVKINNRDYIHTIIFDNSEHENSSHDEEFRKKHLLQETSDLKDSFITMITHEFKTPIAVINAAVQTMEIVCRDDLTQKMNDYLIKIKQNCLRQQRLVDNLLDITRLKAGKMKANYNNVEIVSFTEMIIESARPYIERKPLTLTYQYPCERIIISTDIEKYERIIYNLLSNAIKFTPPNNSISIIMSVLDSNLKVEVKDKGVGIPEDKKSIMFERFEQADKSFSRQAEGTGMGLYLVKLLVDSLGGAVDIESHEGIGSTFSVILPLHHDNSYCPHSLNQKSIHRAASLEFSDVIL